LNEEKSGSERSIKSRAEKGGGDRGGYFRQMGQQALRSDGSSESV